MKPYQPKKRNRISLFVLALVVLVLLTFLVLLQSSNLWKNLAVESASDTILLYALSSLNFFAFVIFGFILLRNLVKLARERRSLVLGSKFKTRLWLYFFAISILPIIAMAGFSYLFMNRALERWFTENPVNVLRESRNVQEKAIGMQAQKFRETAGMLAAGAEGRELDAATLRRIADAGDLSRIEVLARDGRSLASFERSVAGENREALARIVGLAQQRRFAEPEMQDGRGFDAVEASFEDGRRLVVISSVFSEENVSSLVDNSLREFDRLKDQQITIRQIGLSTLGVLTFLLIFASSWAAVYISRGLTVPLNALARGADEIAQGKLGFQVEVLAEDELALLVGSFNQMSAKLAENSAELEERRRYTETVLQSLPTGVISVDGENRVTTINRAAVHILKLEDADFTGLELPRLVVEENRLVFERLINRARRIGRAAEQTVLRRERADGGTDVNASMPVALTATALASAPGSAIGCVVVIEDLSELISAQRASAWAEVARRMAHEIKNPLTPIQLSAERITKNFFRDGAGNGRGDSQLGKVVRDSTDTILREVRSLKSMVDEFSRFARLPNVRLAPGDLNAVVGRAAALFEDRGVSVSLDCAGDLVPAMIDEDQLQRVFVNLIENSVEAFAVERADKKISVRTYFDRARELLVAEVSDNAGGIAPADFQKLFQPYFSTKGRGTGLGLAIVQRIVTEHGGKINAANNSSGGAKFVIELPPAT